MISILLLGIVVATTLTFPKQEKAQAESQTSDIGALTVNGYESNPNSKIFDGDKLRQLYSQIVGKDNATYADLVTKLSTATDGIMNSADFRTTSIGGDEIYVTLNDMKWAVMYLANNYSGQPILTFWLVDSSDIDDSNYSSYCFNDYGASNLGTYPAVMYSTSQVRAICLNNGGLYGTTTSTSDTAKQVANHPFARLTMPNGIYDGVEVKGSLYNYIEVPKQMDWQKNEAALSIGDPDNSNYENDAWSNTIGGFRGLKRASLETVTGYGDWNEDKLWLPSLTEFGYGDTFRGLWKETDAIFYSSASYWSRTAAAGYYARCFINSGSSRDGTSSFNIRPAFHLNLFEVEQNSTIAATSQGEKKKDFYADGVDLEFNLNGVDINKLDITSVCQPLSGETAGTMTYTAGTYGLVTLKASAVGKYTVTVTSKSGECWSDGTSTPIEYIFYIKYRVDEPALIGQTGSMTIIKNYADGEHEIKIAKEFYEPTKYTIKPNTSPSGLTFDDSSGEGIFKVKDVDTYTASVELKDKESTLSVIILSIIFFNMIAFTFAICYNIIGKKYNFNILKEF